MRARDFVTKKIRFDTIILDQLLDLLCEMVIKGQKQHRANGMVGACVLDPRGRMVASTSTRKKGQWMHAEHNAMQRYRDAYGDIPRGSVIVTTLSPCSDRMEDRYGPSCTELINQSPVRQVYCGYMDPSQEGEHDREFELEVTQDPDIRDRCQAMADTFLDRYLDESIQMEAVYSGNLGIMELVKFFREYPQHRADYEKIKQTQGIRAAMEFAMEKMGVKLAGEPYVKENFADKRVKGKSRPGRVRRAGASCAGSVSSLRAKARKYGGERGKMYHWCGNMKAGRQKKK